MLKNLYSLRDLKSGSHKDLFSANNHDEAKRLIHAAALPPSGPTLFANYPDDFALFHHGVFNYTDGSISGEVVDRDDVQNTGAVVAHRIANMREILMEFDKAFRDAELTKKPSRKKGR